MFISKKKHKKIVKDLKSKLKESLIPEYRVTVSILLSNKAQVTGYLFLRAECEKELKDAIEEFNLSPLKVFSNLKNKHRNSINLTQSECVLMEITKAEKVSDIEGE